MTKEKSREASESFLWGVATSAFQIEGYVRNDMTDWEAQGRFRKNGKDPRYEHAVGHWQKWREDFDLLKQLHVNAYRFSVEWARIQPERNRFDEQALDQYERMVDRLLELDIVPMLTLHHFTHPCWFHDKTPWHEPQSVEAFLVYVDKVLRRLGDRIRFYITINEPVVWVLAAYGDAQFPPGYKNFDYIMRALHHLLRAHKESYACIKRYQSAASVGLAKNFIIFRPRQKVNLLHQGLVYLCHSFYNLLLLEAFKKNRLKFRVPFLFHYDEAVRLENCLDFWGVNYYYRLHMGLNWSLQQPIDMHFNRNPVEGNSDLGWEIYADGLWEVLRWVRETGKPMYITENGIADRDDRLRKSYLQHHLRVVNKAVQKGYPLKGYFHWSLLDNYEWLEGREARFGLIGVDYSNSLRRTLRESGQYYSQWIKNFNPTKK